jgi:hypothetical protein
MTYSISCVLLIPVAHHEAVNTLAEALGYGPNNLSVELVAVDGSAWFGGHTWCTQAFLDQLADPAHQNEDTAALIISALVDGEANDNWAQALAANGLTMVPGTAF